MDDLSDLLTISEEVANHGREVQLRMVGEIDMATAPLVEESFTAALGEGYERMVIDLSEVGFMDSSGLNALIRARNILDDRGVNLVISGLSDQVRRLFELSGLMTVFTFAPS